MKLSFLRVCALIFLAAVIVDCRSTVTRTYTKPGLENAELKYVKRVGIVVDKASVAPVHADLRDRMLSYRTREHLTHHSEYIVYPVKTPGPVVDVCKANKKLNGVILLRVLEEKKVGGDLSLNLMSTLLDCKSGDRLWEAEGKRNFEMNDSDFGTLVSGDVKRFGNDARTYSAPFYRMTGALYEKMPMPELTDSERIEKIDADAD